MSNSSYRVEKYFNGARLIYRDGVLIAYVG